MEYIGTDYVSDLGRTIEPYSDEFGLAPIELEKDPVVEGKLLNGIEYVRNNLAPFIERRLQKYGVKPTRSPYVNEVFAANMPRYGNLKSVAGVATNGINVLIGDKYLRDAPQWFVDLIAAHEYFHLLGVKDEKLIDNILVELYEEDLGLPEVAQFIREHSAYLRSHYANSAHESINTSPYDFRKYPYHLPELEFIPIRGPYESPEIIAFTSGKALINGSDRAYRNEASPFYAAAPWQSPTNHEATHHVIEPLGLSYENNERMVRDLVAAGYDATSKMRVSYIV